MRPQVEGIGQRRIGWCRRYFPLIPEVVLEGRSGWGSLSKGGLGGVDRLEAGHFADGDVDFPGGGFAQKGRAEADHQFAARAGDGEEEAVESDAADAFQSLTNDPGLPELAVLALAAETVREVCDAQLVGIGTEVGCNGQGCSR